MLRAAILDFGGVLALRPGAEAFGRMAALCGFDDSAAFEAAWLRHRLPYDRGALTAAEYWRLVGLDDESRVDELLLADAEAWSRPNLALADWLSRLKDAGFLTALLSNVPREHWSLLSPFYRSWLADCDELTLSFELGVSKPDERIFHHCLDHLGVEPGEALFVDDELENVTAAAAVGLQAFHFTGVEALHGELRSRLDRAVPLPDCAEP
jgi:putative hydrolase of the HAD superfamily